MSPKGLISLCLKLWLLSIFIYSINGELHRAKPAKKHGPSLTANSGGVKRFPPGAFSDHDNEAIVTGDKSQLGSEDDAVPTMTPMIAGHSTETWIYSLVSAGLVGLSGIFPLLIIPLEAGKALRHGAPAARLKLLLSFAVGGLLGDVFLHLLPEAWAHLHKVGHDSHDAHSQIGLWIISGIFTFLIIEKIFPEGHDDDEDEEKEDKLKSTTVPEPKSSQIITGSQQKKSQSTANKSETTTARNRKNKKNHKDDVTNGHATNGNSHLSNGHSATNGHTDTSQADTKEEEVTIKTSGWLNLLANVIDNFTHGLAVAGSYCISTKTGLITTCAVLLHEVPHEVGDFAILLRSGFDRWRAAKAQLLTASGGILGALAALLSESAEVAGDRTAWILPFTSGGFIYIALVTVVPDLLTEKNPRQSALQVVLILLGIGLVSGVTLLCE